MSKLSMVKGFRLRWLKWLPLNCLECASQKRASIDCNSVMEVISCELLELLLLLGLVLLPLGLASRSLISFIMSGALSVCVCLREGVRR